MVKKMFSVFCSLGLLHLFQLCSPVFGMTYPASLPQCKPGDTSCLKSVMTTIIKTQAAGNKELALKPIDPLKLDKFSIVQDERSPVNIRLHLRNITVTGISDIVVSKVVGFEEDLKTSKFEVTGKTKRLTFVGNYTLNGQVLVLPIAGNGLANLTFENVNIHIKVFPKIEVRDGKEYAIINKDTVKVRFTTKKFIPYFSNLFNNAQISKNMNTFLQESSGDIFREVKKSVEKAVAEVVGTVVSGPFGAIPYRELFLP